MGAHEYHFELPVQPGTRQRICGNSLLSRCLLRARQQGQRKTATSRPPKQVPPRPRAHCHRFRHTLATETLGKGGTIEEVANILADSPATVHRRYIDVESVMELKRSSHEANRFIKQGAADAELWARFRGMQYGCRYAEAFVEIQTVAKMPAENLAPRRWYYGGLRMHSDY